MEILFDSWVGLFRTVVVGVCAYAALILLLRISGKRTLSKMNAFDFVVTVALGSILATTILSKDTALLEGIAALAVLLSLQFLITWLSVRFDSISHIIKAEPKLLFHKGVFLPGAMRAERVNEDEVLHAIRSQGIGQHHQVEAVVLETDGSMSVVRKDSGAPTTVLADVS